MLIVTVGGSLALLIVAALCFVYLTPSRATGFFINLERSAAGLQRRELILPDGTRMCYLEGGQGAPLVLLHGFGGDKDHFDRVAKYLTAHFHVISPDLTGFGESTHPPATASFDFSAQAQAERVRALVQVLGLKCIDLGGNSMGGQIALAYAAAYPEEVTSLWLISPAGIWSAPPSELAQQVAAHQHNLLLIRNTEDYRKVFKFVMSRPPLVPGPILDVMAQTSIRNLALLAQIFGQITADSLEARISGLKIPTLIVWGDQDRVIAPRTAHVLAGLLPASQVILMAGVGHMAMVEEPKACARDYLRFRAAGTI